MKTRMNSKDAQHREVMHLSSNMVAEEATSSGGEVQTVNAMMLTRKCLGMTSLGFK